MVRIKFTCTNNVSPETKELYRFVTSRLGCQGNVTESVILKGAHLALLLLPSTSGGWKTWVKVQREKERGENKTRGRVEPAARSTCQKTLETTLRCQMLRRLALRRPAKRAELTNHFSLSHCEQRTGAYREIKTLHNASTQQIWGGGWVERETVSTTATSTDLGKGGRDATWPLTNLSDRIRTPALGREVLIRRASSPTLARNDEMEGSTCQQKEGLQRLGYCCAERAMYCSGRAQSYFLTPFLLKDILHCTPTLFCLFGTGKQQSVKWNIFKK